MQGKVRVLQQWDGAKDGWQCNLSLRGDEEAVVVDATALRFAVPTFLLRLRAFVEWHLEREHRVEVIAPRSRQERSRLLRRRPALRATQ